MPLSMLLLTFTEIKYNFNECNKQKKVEKADRLPVCKCFHTVKWTKTNKTDAKQPTHWFVSIIFVVWFFFSFGFTIFLPYSPVNFVVSTEALYGGIFVYLVKMQIPSTNEFLWLYSFVNFNYADWVNWFYVINTYMSCSMPWLHCHSHSLWFYSYRTIVQDTLINFGQ